MKVYLVVLDYVSYDESEYIILKAFRKGKDANNFLNDFSKYYNDQVYNDACYGPDHVEFPDEYKDSIEKLGGIFDWYHNCFCIEEIEVIE